MSSIQVVASVEQIPSRAVPRRDLLTQFGSPFYAAVTRAIDKGHVRAYRTEGPRSTVFVDPEACLVDDTSQYGDLIPRAIKALSQRADVSEIRAEIQKLQLLKDAAPAKTPVVCDLPPTRAQFQRLIELQEQLLAVWTGAQPAPSAATA